MAAASDSDSCYRFVIDSVYIWGLFEIIAGREILSQSFGGEKTMFDDITREIESPDQRLS